MSTPPRSTPVNLFGMSMPELEAECASIGLPRFRATQLFYWLYNRAAASFDEMANLPKTLRATLAQRYAIVHPRIVTEQHSADGTRKFLLELEDGRRIESVLIPSESDEPDARKRLTLCVSTQVGCPLACRFCATASMKLARNLAAGEIAGQWIAVQAVTPKRITNLVYMGMGEPLLNYEAVMASIDLITHETTCGVGAGRITVSTAGLVDGIRRMADDGRNVKLAISLHATTDALRDALMPINRRHDIGALLEAAEYYYRRTRRRITYEYILFDGINDGVDDAHRLARIARRVPSKVNLIPFHAIDAAYPDGAPMPLQPSAPDAIRRFADTLRADHVTVMLRSSSGKDIDAACGQLAVRATGRRRARAE